MQLTAHAAAARRLYGGIDRYLATATELSSKRRTSLLLSIDVTDRQPYLTIPASNRDSQTLVSTTP